MEPLSPLVAIAGGLLIGGAAALRAFSATAAAPLAAAEAQVSAAEAAAKELAECFAEDARTTPPSAVFAVLRRFAADFGAAVRLLQSKRARLARETAAAAASSTGGVPGTASKAPPPHKP